MKKNLTIFASLVFAGLLPLSAQAQTEEKKTINFMADCGIGGAIFKNDIGGTLSNIIWDWGLTATTSGLSSPDTCEGADVVAAEFIHQTYDNLAEETAIGEGDHISALLDIYACDSSVRTTVTTDVRSAFGESLSAKSYQASTDLEKSQQYFDIVKNAVSSCKA